MSLSSLLIGYRPVIDRDRRIMALQVRFASLGEEPTRLSDLYRLMAGDRPLQSHTLLLSAPQAEFDAGLSDLEPTPGLWLEVPATVAEDPEHQQMLLLLHDRGMGMVLQGTPHRCPRSCWRCFGWPWWMSRMSGGARRASRTWG